MKGSTKSWARGARRFGELTGRCGVSPTFPIAAVAVARSPRTVRRLQAEGVEFAIHGLVHNDYTEMSGRRQEEAIGQAKRIFEREGIEAHGFRAPYLHADADTLRAVHANGLGYDSSRAVAFPVLPEALTSNVDGYARAIRYYRAMDAGRVVSRPRLDTGLVTIPVAVPGDEIMVDRFHLTDQQQIETWSTLLDLTHDRGELFTIQLHPERFRRCEAALTAVLSQARRLPVWLANLRDVEQWWRRRATARIDIGEAGDGTFQVSLVGPSDARLMLRTEVNGTERAVGERSVQLSRRPVVGVARHSPSALSGFLREEGYVVQVDAHPDAVGAFLRIADPDFDEIEVLRQVAAGPGPVVRVGRWPGGRRSALAISGDVDAMRLPDLFLRYWEAHSSGRDGPPGRSEPTREPHRSNGTRDA